MSARCQVTGTGPGFGHNVSHSQRRTKRRFNPNLQSKPHLQSKAGWVPSLNRRVTLRVSARGIKTIDQRGIDAVVASILARGEKV